MIKDPVISVIIPIYNVEKYLGEAVDSILNQTIGFEENIELIIINDGSKDKSGEIAEDYAKRFPNNIVYKKQKNAGAHKAREKGLSFARAKYVHFLDADDTISKNYYQEIIRFFDDNYDKIDFVATKYVYFDSRQGDHYLNERKFYKDRIIDVNKETDMFQYSMATCVFKKDKLNGEDLFNNQLVISEDARTVSIILREKKTYGVVAKAQYNYRIRPEEGSLLSGQVFRKDYYTETPKKFWQFVLDYWRDDSDKIPEYIQRLVLQDMQWRINYTGSKLKLSEKDEKEYNKTCLDVVRQIDDSVILKQEKMSLPKKIFILKQKYGSDFEKKLKFQDNKYYLGDDVVFDFNNDIKIYQTFFDFVVQKNNSKFFIEGFNSVDRISSKDQIFIRTREGDFELKQVERAQRGKDGFFGKPFVAEEAFEANIEVQQDDKVLAIYKTADGSEFSLKIHPKVFTKIGPQNRSYCQFGDKILRLKNGVIFVKKNHFLKRFGYETMLILIILCSIRPIDTARLVKWGLIGAQRFIFGSREKSTREVVFDLVKPTGFFIRNMFLNLQNILLRMTVHILPAPQKRIWILSDRRSVAGDNGEALFKFLVKENDPELDVYFAIDRKSLDYGRLSKIGKVLKIDSFIYKYKFLRASKIVSAHADDFVYNAFGSRCPHMNNLMNFDFVFLQHGIAKDDLSPWVNRFDKNIRLFITSAKDEYESMFDCDYYYRKNEVALTGLPRYDLLESNPKKEIMLAPTWRNALTKKTNKSGVFGYSEDFKDTEYFHFYNGLMNNEEILGAMRKARVKGRFFLHPALQAQSVDFEENDTFKIEELPYNYKKAFEESNLLITDFSSVAFDVGYLKKPVIYTHFDRDTFFDIQVYDPGYFSYEEDGFGPVVYDFESAKKTIINVINGGMKLEPKYKKRIDNFFAFSDKNNSRRVYEAILKIDK